MEKAVKIIGGVVIAIAAVLIIFHVFTDGGILHKLKDTAKQDSRYDEQIQKGYEKAVLADPQLCYVGKTAKTAGKECQIFEEVQVTDTADDYDKSLKEAVAEKRITIKEMKVFQITGAETKILQTGINIEDGTIDIKEPGIYQISISGMDKYHNSVGIEYLVVMNLKEV